MSMERTDVHTLRKPWGRRDLSPWAMTQPGEAMGEMWFERANASDHPAPQLLLKLLFTSEPLSIQVHPGDAFAKSIGLRNGKTEAWYVLSAEPGAEVAVGLSTALTPQQLRQAILDGSIQTLVNWRSVVAGDTVFVPAGTIHAIGSGLVIAEIQQRSDTTFRLFDYGRGRDLHVDEALAVATLVPAATQTPAVRLTTARTLLISSPFFTLEHIAVPSNSLWELAVDCECWVIVIAGAAQFGSVQGTVGVALCTDKCRTKVTVGDNGLAALIAYADATPAPGLFSEVHSKTTTSRSRIEAHLMDHETRRPTYPREELQ